MDWRKLISPFVLVPLTAGLLGNISIGIIAAGLTGLVWGLESGALFISMTTTILVVLTGNINMEIIFLYCLTMAYLQKEYHLLHYLDRRITYLTLFVISICTVPLWRGLLGLIPAGLLNQLNISGELLVITGIFLFILRSKILLVNSISIKDFLEYILFFICSIFGLVNSILLIPCWLAGIFLLEKFQDKLQRVIYFQRESFLLFIFLLILLAALAADIVLPIGFIMALLVLVVAIFIFRNLDKIPLVEVVYLSVVLGIVAARIGLLL